MEYLVRRATEQKIKGIIPSHNEARQIQSGPQMGMWSKEITNYNGFGPIITVVGQSKEEAENLAIIISDMVKEKLEQK